MNSFNLKPIVREETTKERVYKEIKRAILNGMIPSGEIFTEVKMAELLNISRTPVREALQDLIKEGLVITIPRKGLTVRKVTEEEIDQVFLLRAAIEREVVRKLTGKITDEQLEQLEQICKEQEKAKDDQDNVTFINLDQVFHITLTKFARMELVEQVLMNLQQLTVLIGLQGVRRKSRMDEVLVEHRRILKALKEQDAEQATIAVTEHLKQSKESLQINK